MINMRFLLKFFDFTFLVKFFFLALLFSLIPLCEIYLLLYVGRMWGGYFTIAVSASSGLIGVFLALKEVHILLGRIKTKIQAGNFPAEDFSSLAGVLVGSVLLIIPGFITDALGLLFLLPGFRKLVGRVVVAHLGNRLQEAYEYLKLS